MTIVKLGDVLKKEREKKGLSVEEVASAVGIPQGDYERLEGGSSEAEKWGPLLAQIAIELETPTARLLAESGRSTDCKPGQAGGLIHAHRERRGKSAEQLQEALANNDLLDADSGDFAQVESGESPIETVGPQLLAFAETIEQPVFNLFYPCGLPFQELDDYP